YRRRRRSPSGSASRRAWRTTSSSPCAGTSRSTTRSRPSTATSTRSSRSAGGSARTSGRTRVHEGSRMSARRRPSPAWLLVGPALLLLVVFFGVPVLAAFVLSLTDFDIYALARPERLRFVGAGNYRALVGDPRFWRALGNTAYFVLVGGPLSIAVSLGA